MGAVMSYWMIWTWLRTQQEISSSKDTACGLTARLDSLMLTSTHASPSFRKGPTRISRCRCRRMPRHPTVGTISLSDGRIHRVKSSKTGLQYAAGTYVYEGRHLRMCVLLRWHVFIYVCTCVCT